MPSKKPNYKTIHGHGCIELYINDELKKSVHYSSFDERVIQLKKLERIYPIRSTQKRYFHIVPKWEMWNGIIGELEYDEDILEIEIENYERNSKYLRKLA